MTCHTLNFVLQHSRTSSPHEFGVHEFGMQSNPAHAAIALRMQACLSCIASYGKWLEGFQDMQVYLLNVQV